jgi:hypothetical protein
MNTQAANCRYYGGTNTMRRGQTKGKATLPLSRLRALLRREPRPCRLLRSRPHRRDPQGPTTRSTNMLERLFEEVKRGTKVVGVFPNETSRLATEIMLRSSEEWALKRYLTMEALEVVGKPNPQHSRR